MENEDWEDAISGALFDVSGLEDEDMFEGEGEEIKIQPSENQEQEYPDDAFRLSIKHFKIKVQQGGKGEEYDFIKFAKNSIDIDVSLEDKHFNRASTGQEKYPLKRK